MSRFSGVADWSARRSFPARRDAAEVRGLKNASVSVVLPARRVAGTLPAILRSLEPHHESGLIDELIVMLHSPGDETERAARSSGADVYLRDDVLADFGPSLGKGDALWRGTSVARGDLVVFIDTDTRNFGDHFLFSMLAPLFSDETLQFVKGSFHRPLSLAETSLEEEGGRVTELTARPLLNLYAPELSGFVQPLAGEIAARRDLLMQIPFAAGFGVEIAMLIDVCRKVGVDALGQADLVSRVDSNRPLRELTPMAYAVLAAVAKRFNMEAEPGIFLARPDAAQETEVVIEERPPLAEVGGST